jgi:hypothetical protein
MTTLHIRQEVAGIEGLRNGGGQVYGSRVMYDAKNKGWVAVRC